MVDLLTSYGGNKDKMDDRGFTPGYYARHYGHMELANRLMPPQPSYRPAPYGYAPQPYYGQQPAYPPQGYSTAPQRGGYPAPLMQVPQQAPGYYAPQPQSVYQQPYQPPYQPPMYQPQSYQAPAYPQYTPPLVSKGGGAAYVQSYDLPPPRKESYISQRGFVPPVSAYMPQQPYAPPPSMQPVMQQAYTPMPAQLPYPPPQYAQPYAPQGYGGAPLPQANPYR
jgi:hypothetical protein